MNGVLGLMLIFLICCIPAAIGLVWGRWDAYGGWHKRYRHTCGYHTKYKTQACPKCGKEDDEYEALTGRALFPLGWEFKK